MHLPGLMRALSHWDEWDIMELDRYFGRDRWTNDVYVSLRRVDGAWMELDGDEGGYTMDRRRPGQPHETVWECNYCESMDDEFRGVTMTLIEYGSDPLV